MPAAPLLSLAWTLTPTVPLTVPATGLSIATTGGAVSLVTGGAALATFTETGLDAPAWEDDTALTFLHQGMPALQGGHVLPSRRQQLLVMLREIVAGAAHYLFFGARVELGERL